MGELESCAGVSMLKKTPVIGTGERGGKVKAQVADYLTGKGVLKFIRRNVKPGSSRLITDEYQAWCLFVGALLARVVQINS